MELNIKKTVLSVALVAAVCAIAVFVFAPGARTPTQQEDAAERTIRPKTTERRPFTMKARNDGVEPEAEESPMVEDGEGEAESSPEVESEPEDPESALEEKLVDEFDALADKWQEPASDKVTMNEVDKFREQFKKIPRGRQEECIQRALNLVPDENVMLLAGILFDKEQSPEILEAIYNDILNRDEEVKKPILKEVYKDKDHPCWADTAWILDVTGELPNKEAKKE